jgi:NAD+ diphosphatase
VFNIQTATIGNLYHVNSKLVVSTNSKNYWIIVNKDKILSTTPEEPLLLTDWSALPFAHEYEDQIVAIGEHNDKSVYLLDLGHESVDTRLHSVSLRNALTHCSTKNFNLLAKAWQYALFLRTHRYCGQCGTPMHRVSWEMAMHCHNCQHRCYPRVSPCIIVSIYKDNQILLAMGTRHKEVGMYSTLAGFVESGESLEEAVHREVKEEVGIKIKNLRYFDSQAWPFPHSIMMGYIAEHASGEINIDDDEICDANWYEIDQLPKIPPLVSIAGQLIQATREIILAKK